MKQMIAEDAMVPLDSYPHMPYWFTLRQAIVEMEKGELERDGRKSLPRFVLIFDEQYQLMGLLRRRDVFRGLEPDYLEKTTAKTMVDDNSDFSELSRVDDIDGLRTRAETPVSAVMQPIKATVNYNDSLLQVVNLMVHHDMSVLPVMKNDSVIGVVRSVDVFREIAKMVL